MGLLRQYLLALLGGDTTGVGVLDEAAVLALSVGGVAPLRDVSVSSLMALRACIASFEAFASSLLGGSTPALGVLDEATVLAGVVGGSTQLRNGSEGLLWLFVFASRRSRTWLLLGAWCKEC